MVLGISGGIDSTVSAAICHEVSKRTGIPFYGVSLMCSTNEDDEVTTADLVGVEYCDYYMKYNMQDIYEHVEQYTRNIVEDINHVNGRVICSHSPLSDGNIKARMRMITLYDLASCLGGIVIDTDNLTEHYLGFWTLHGDEGDLNIIGSLWKTEVYKLADYIRSVAPNEGLLKSCELVPTDGNGVKAGGDLAQIAPGLTYDDVDVVIQALVSSDYSISDDIKKTFYKRYGKTRTNGIIERVMKSAYKRMHRPLVVSATTGLVHGKTENRI
jgi:nicotinamide-nucleotide amidase